MIFGLVILLERTVRKYPNGFIISATMALWGLSRFFEEHFWLGPRAQVGSGVSESSTGPWLVQAAGLALFAAGAGMMLVLWRRRRARETADSSRGDRRREVTAAATG